MRRSLTSVVSAFLLSALAVPVFAATGGHVEGYVPAVAHVEGKFGSFWTSDLWIYQQGATTIHFWLNPPGQDNTDGESVVVALDEPVVFLPDVVATLFGSEGSGSLHSVSYTHLTLPTTPYV